MGQLTVPPGGLTLVDPLTSSTDSKTDDKQSQIMQLDLEAGLLQELLRSARHGGKGVSVAFGKTIALHYGNKSQRLILTPSSPSSQAQLYQSSTESETDLAFAGRLSHKLVMQKAKEDMAGTDAALEKLQSQLASHKEAKQSMQIKYVPDSSKLPPPVKQTAAALKHKTGKSNALSFMKKNNPRHLQQDTTRSMPASPSLGAARTALTSKLHPTSTPSLPNGKTQRLQALRIPLIHFLAGRPASTKLLSNHLGCKEDEVLDVLQKVGKHHSLDQAKWDLTDKAFKELDVWSFNYPNQDERDLAINRARSAFDRMRLSTQEPLWDKLLPKHERGKGTILSHLNLHKGPIQQASTPKIHIQPSSNESSKDQHLHGDESDQKDRLAPSDAEPKGRSKSQGPIKRKKVSEKEAQSKRLLSNGPKKATSESKSKVTHPAVKKGDVKKVNAPKSSEFVHESDEEDGLDDTAALPFHDTDRKKDDASREITDSLASSRPASSLKVNGLEAKESNRGKMAVKSENPKPTARSHPVPSTKLNRAPKVKKAAEVSKPAPADLSAAKPSVPSLPGSSSRGGPTVSKASTDGKKEKNNAGLPTKPRETSHSSSTASSNTPRNQPSDSSQGSNAMQRTISRQRNTSSPRKPSPLGSSPPTNASDLDNNVHSSNTATPQISKVRKDNLTPNGASIAVNGHTRNTPEHTLKRKAGDLDSGIHNHGPSLTNGNVNSKVNGNVNVSKRQKTSPIGSSSSDSSDSPLARNIALKKALDFKRYYANYEKQYQEVNRMNEAPAEKVEELIRMHHRLSELKDQITRGLVGL